MVLRLPSLLTDLMHHLCSTERGKTVLKWIQYYRPFVERANTPGFELCAAETLCGTGIEFVWVKVGMLIVGVERRRDIESELYLR